MKAVVLKISKDFGSLAVEEVEVPPCGPQEVVVRVRAVSINAADYRSIQMGMVPRRRILGADVAGTVVEVGPEVTELHPGDEVVADLSNSGFGGFAEYAVADAKAFVAKPSALSFVDAAALPLAALSADAALNRFGLDLEGRDVIVWGASGGVGSFAVQLARHAGARVRAVCGPSNLSSVASLGAEVYDYTKPVPPGPGADLLVVVHGNHSLGFYRRYLKAEGRCIVVGGSLGQIFGAMFTAPFLSWGRQKFAVLSFRSDPGRLRWLLDLAAQGSLRSSIETVQGLDQVPAQLQAASQGHTRGKVVIEIPQ